MLRAMLFTTLGLLLTVLGMGCGHSEGPASGVEPETVEDRSVACPALIQVKYPFLRCERDAYGHAVLAHEPQILITSQMPDLDPYVEGDAYWR